MDPVNYHSWQKQGRLSLQLMAFPPLVSLWQMCFLFKFHFPPSSFDFFLYNLKKVIWDAYGSSAALQTNTVSKLQPVKHLKMCLTLGMSLKCCLVKIQKYKLLLLGKWAFVKVRLGNCHSVQKDYNYRKVFFRTVNTADIVKIAHGMLRNTLPAKYIYLGFRQRVTNLLQALIRKQQVTCSPPLCFLRDHQDPQGPQDHK